MMRLRLNQDCFSKAAFQQAFPLVKTPGVLRSVFDAADVQQKSLRQCLQTDVRRSRHSALLNRDRQAKDSGEQANLRLLLRGKSGKPFVPAVRLRPSLKPNRPCRALPFCEAPARRKG